MKSIFLGILASLFFAVTFVLNREMNISGGSWIWSAALRYIFMLPTLFIIVAVKSQSYIVIKDIIRRPVKWVLCSTAGFGLFYAPLTFASVYGSSWLVAGTWQIIQSLIVALCSGVIATILFFRATEIVKNNMHKLAIVEATQSGEVIFTLIGGLLLFHDKTPTAIGLIGISFIILGMVLNSIMSV